MEADNMISTISIRNGRVPVYGKSLVPAPANQLRVSDITYIHNLKGLVT